MAPFLHQTSTTRTEHSWYDNRDLVDHHTQHYFDVSRHTLFCLIAFDGRGSRTRPNYQSHWTSMVSECAHCHGPGYGSVAIRDSASVMGVYFHALAPWFPDHTGSVRRAASGLPHAVQWPRGWVCGGATISHRFLWRPSSRGMDGSMPDQAENRVWWSVPGNTHSIHPRHHCHRWPGAALYHTHFRVVIATYHPNNRSRKRYTHPPGVRTDRLEQALPTPIYAHESA